MGQKLLIVESPSKAKSISKYLGGGWVVLASFGHVVDLVNKSGSVEPDNNFHMHYQTIERNKDKLKAIINSAQGKEGVYLASDPDREGEAIAWHIKNALEAKLKGKCPPIYRVTFHEISERAIKEAIKEPRDVDMNMVNAQQARRALDYLVGFTLSPLLWQKVRPQLSAGRVQSPALRLITEREHEIKNFVPTEYWSIKLHTTKSNVDFKANLVKFKGEQVAKQSIPSLEAATKLVDALKGKEAVVSQIKKKSFSQSPYAPFTTSTLQQDGVRKLNMSSDRVMKAAQKLYEGTGNGGYITYMRTDSINLSAEAINDIRSFVSGEKTLGKQLLPNSPREYKTKAKNAQEAHEAIRPTKMDMTPDRLRQESSLDQDELKLYALIWKRTIASQLVNAEFESTVVDIDCGDGQFRANGKVLVFPGFLAVYDVSKDIEDDSEDNSLPSMSEGDKLPNKDVVPEQHFTKPPPRINEGSIVEILDDYGIGRPSTYASIIKLLKDKEYITLDKKRFVSSDKGDAMIAYLTDKFGQYVDYEFTSNLENRLDDIAVGKVDWLTVMNEFWGPFNQTVQSERADKSRASSVMEMTDDDCPKCNASKLAIKLGRYGKYLSCASYPTCDYKRNLGDKPKAEVEIVEGMKCPECGNDMCKRKGRYGDFISCTNYPTCKHIHSDKPKAEKTGETCPACKKGELVIRVGKRGKFKACNRFPKCKHIENIE